MKKTLLSLIMAAITQYGFSQTAVNFTANDCSASSHDLFTELDAGKVIVLCWVMPCGACISSAATASTKAKSYATSNPGRVKFYLVDDVANTTCSSLTGWASTNSITFDAAYSNAAIKMTDYGTSGMPKTIVLGGANHTVFYNVNGTVSSTALGTAITNALNATTAVSENNNVNMAANVFPNPAVSVSKLSYTLTQSCEVNVDILNMLGEKMSTVSLGMRSAGKQEYQLNFESLFGGIYFVRLVAGEAVQTVKCVVVR